MGSFFLPETSNDPLYERTRDGVEDYWIIGRDHIEKLWGRCEQFIDPDAKRKALSDFASVYWELQLAYALCDAGKALVPRGRMQYKRNRGPDLFAEGPSVWLEAIVPRPGNGPDALPYPELREIYSYDPDAVVLRLRSAIKDKSEKISNYIEAGIIKPDQAIIIAISSVLFPVRNTGLCPPEIVKALYPVSHRVLEVERATGVVRNSHYEYRNVIKKDRGACVATDVFLDSRFAHVSAVLFDETDWVNPGYIPGADFVMVHNSCATTPLPDGWFPRGREYWWRTGDQLKCKQH